MKWSFLSVLLLGLFVLGSCERVRLPSPDLEGCDTTAVSYSEVVVPILSANCYQCHAGDTPIAGFSFDTHTSLQALTDDLDAEPSGGILLCVIQHDCDIMPPSGEQLATCDIKKIERWIADGAQDN